MKYLLLILLFSPLQAFAESPEYFVIEHPSEYVISIDEHVYSILYQIDAQVLAMAIDPELNSLLIGLENTRDSIFVIDLPHEMINAENNEFAILVNGYEVDYEIVSDSDSSTFAFFVPEFTEEVEIIGTFVIPEFPLGSILILFILLTITTIFVRTKTNFRL